MVFESGSFEISLTVTSENFCSSTTSSLIEIPKAPLLNFELNSLCAGEPIVLTDISVSGTNPIVSRTWYLDGNSFFNGEHAQLIDIEGTHEIKLETTTKSGCTYSLTQIIELLPPPTAEFEASEDYGIPPFEINFVNNSVELGT